MSEPKIQILKFGSSVLRNEEDLSTVVHEIYRVVRSGRRVVAVVSAIGRTTDALLAQAKRIAGGTEPSQAALATLLATGELASLAAVGIALDKVGIPATILDPDAIALTTSGSVLDGEPTTLDKQRILTKLKEKPVVVVPGFFGRSSAGNIGLFGRGGSDLTAVFLTAQLGAEKCVLVKDVDGLYESDPNDPHGEPRRFATMGWDDAIRIGGKIVQAKAIRHARDHEVVIEVRSPAGLRGTLIGDLPCKLDGVLRKHEPLKVGLLGLGTVGLGVYQELSRHPELFEVVRIAVRDLDKDRGYAVPRELLTTDPWKVLETDCDILVELIGGIEPAASIIESALRKGLHVVTANKAVIARHGASLRVLAGIGELVYSAAVGGAVPAIELVRTLRKQHRIRRLRGVLNGTCNFVLDRLSEGQSLQEAVKLAQVRGFAEADPSVDLDGTDSAHKLAILAREGFDCDLPLTAIAQIGVDLLDASEVHQAALEGDVYRLVASVHIERTGVRATVEPIRLRVDDSLASLVNEENGLVVELDNGKHISISGKGAGRWPTTESVVADLFDLVRRTHRKLHTAKSLETVRQPLTSKSNVALAIQETA